MSFVCVATCNLNQWALDFDGNARRIRQSVAEAKARGARYRVGPELEITGYGCEDHFLEMDTFLHAWESLASLLSDETTEGILCDFGMPVMHKGVRYNCRVFCLDHRVVLIRPKMSLADDGNYREGRYFTAWGEHRTSELESCELPPIVTRATGGQTVAPFGIGVVATRDAAVASESCEELFTARSPHIALGLDGVDIISNGSGSHHQLRKLNTRVDLIRSATSKSGGVYLYANQQGCDGGRLYYDGCALVAVNGELVAQASQFSLVDVEVVTAVVDLDDVRSYRAAIASRGHQARTQSPFPRVRVDFALGSAALSFAKPSPARAPVYHSPEEEIGMGPACWLWDYLRRSGASGYFLPLSGGADSSAVCSIVGVMARLVVDECARGNAEVLEDARRVLGKSGTDYVPRDPKEVAQAVLHTCYMGTTNSSAATRDRAATLAAQVGTYHLTATIDAIIEVFLTVFFALVGRRPAFAVHGGTRAEDLAMQNIQARVRMVFAYLLAQLLPWVRGRTGYLLVLGSANVDEALRGYMTKYDCSSADLNPIGAVAKEDLKRFLRWASRTHGFTVLDSVLSATPTAELVPIVHKSAGSETAGAAPEGAVASATAAAAEAAASSPSSSSSTSSSSSSSSSSSPSSTEPEEHSQADEADMGMTYAELGWFGRLRKIQRCGPLSMYRKLVGEWSHLTPTEVAAKVKRFFFYYGINRHKMTVLTPSYHAESYSPDDNRFDLRPFLYPKWERAFAAIDADVALRAEAAESSR